jgi:hypothetical protein
MAQSGTAQPHSAGLSSRGIAMTQLRCCEGCSRHVRLGERTCPFCRRELAPPTAAVLPRPRPGLSRTQRLTMAAAMAGQVLGACAETTEGAPVPTGGAPIAGSAGQARPAGGGAGRGGAGATGGGAGRANDAGRGGAGATGGGAGRANDAGRGGVGATGGEAGRANDAGRGGVGATGGEAGRANDAGRGAAGGAGRNTMVVLPPYGVPPPPDGGAGD